MIRVFSILENGSKTSRELVELMGDKNTHTLSSILQQYLWQDYITKRYSTRKKRLIYRLTDKGREKLEWICRKIEKELLIDMTTTPYNNFKTIRVQNEQSEYEINKNSNEMIKPIMRDVQNGK